MTILKNKHHVFQALEAKQFFKLVCGASLTDVLMVENLSFLFTLAGAHVIDLAPQADVILAARKGMERAQISSPLLMASIQLDKDPHFRKIDVNYDLCDLCSACVKVCPTEAFKIENKKFVYLRERCFGCGICPSKCHVSALNLIQTTPTSVDTLREMLLIGVKAIEFHFGKNIYKINEIWDEIKSLVQTLELVSFSIGSELLNREEIKIAANLCYKLAGKGIILQCDGKPMSGGKEFGNNTDKESLEVAKIIQEENLPVYLHLSGGTNERSFNHAIQAGLNVHGVAIGSYARKLLMPYLKTPLWDDKYMLKAALQITRSLVRSLVVT